MGGMVELYGGRLVVFSWRCWVRWGELEWYSLRWLRADARNSMSRNCDQLGEVGERPVTHNELKLAIELI